MYFNYFSTCWMISIFSLASWSKTIAFWTVFLRILVCESPNYISKNQCSVISAVNTLYAA